MSRFRLLRRSPPTSPPPPPAGVLGYPTSAQRAALPDIWAANGPWVQYVDANAAPTGLGDDYGMFRTIKYMATGNSADARAAIDRFFSLTFDSPTTRNLTREHTFTLAWMYYELREHCTVQEQSDWEDILHLYATLIRQPGYVIYNGAGWGTAVADSDETVGHYFGLAVIDIVLGTTYLTDAVDVDWTHPSDMRAAIQDYCENLAAGGEWIESSDYNPGTSWLLMAGAHMAGIANYPEVATLAAEMVTTQLYLMTPDLLDCIQWGDIEHPHSPLVNHRMGLWAVLIGCGYDTTGKLTSLMSKIMEVYTPGDWGGHLAYRLLQGVDERNLPASPDPEDYQSYGTRYCSGVGLLIHRGPTHLWYAFGGNVTGVHHDLQITGDTRLYLNGQWVIEHPRGYIADARAHNSGFPGGLTVAMADRGVVSASGDANGATMVCQTSGPPGNRAGAAPAFLLNDGWVRTFTFTAPDTLVVTDAYDGIPVQAEWIDSYTTVDDERNILLAQSEGWIMAWVWHVNDNIVNVSPGVYDYTVGGTDDRRITVSGHSSAGILDEILFEDDPVNYTVTGIDPNGTEVDGFQQLRIYLATGSGPTTVTTTLAPAP